MNETPPLAKLGAPPQTLKRSQASLFGGLACGVAVFILALLLTGSVTPLHILAALVIGAALAAWVRLADL